MGVIHSPIDLDRQHGRRRSPLPVIAPPASAMKLTTGQPRWPAAAAARPGTGESSPASDPEYLMKTGLTFVKLPVDDVRGFIMN